MHLKNLLKSFSSTIKDLLSVNHYVDYYEQRIRKKEFVETRFKFHEYIHVGFMLGNVSNEMHTQLICQFKLISIKACYSSMRSMLVKCF